jgi:hypothetical protein
MKIQTSFPILLALAFVLASCTTYAPASSSTANLGEAKAANAVRQFLSTLDKSTALTYESVAYRNLKLVSTGPIIVEGNKRRVPIKLSAETLVVPPGTPATKEFDEFAVFEPSEDGMWYLTKITYLGEVGIPTIEAK